MNKRKKDKPDTIKITEALEAAGYEVVEVKRQFIPLDAFYKEFSSNGMIEIKVKSGNCQTADTPQ